MNEENKVIAEYMGGVFKGETVRLNEHPFLRDGSGIIRDINNLEYHLRWDWIMPVYKRVTDDAYKILDEYNDVTLYIYISRLLGDAHSQLMSANLPALHETIVNIIKLLNEQK